MNTSEKKSMGAAAVLTTAIAVVSVLLLTPAPLFSQPARGAAAATTAGDAGAHQPAVIEGLETPRGFYLGIKLAGSSLHIDQAADGLFFIKDDGGGVQIDLGYRFNPAFALEVSLGGSRHDTSDPRIDANVTSLALLGYYRFSPQRPFRPYVKFGVGAHALEVKYGDASARIEGGGLALGGGFKYFFNQHFALGLDLTTNLIQFDSALISLGGFSYDFEIDEEGSLTTLGISFAYHF